MDVFQGVEGAQQIPAEELQRIAGRHSLLLWDQDQERRRQAQEQEQEEGQVGSSQSCE